MEMAQNPESAFHALRVLKALSEAVLDAGMRITAENKHSAKKELMHVTGLKPKQEMFQEMRLLMPSPLSSRRWPEEGRPAASPSSDLSFPCCVECEHIVEMWQKKGAGMSWLHVSNMFSEVGYTLGVRAAWQLN